MMVILKKKKLGSNLGHFQAQGSPKIGFSAYISTEIRTIYA